MSRFGYMVERKMNPEAIPVLLDLGYADDEATWPRVDALLAAGVSRRRFSNEGPPGRILCAVPPTKLADLMERLPIIEGSTYWQTTHHWRGLAKSESA